MTPYSIDQLITALSAALSTAAELNSPSGICIVDDGGHVLLHARHPQAPVAAADSALAKAQTAVWLHADTGSIPATSPIIPALSAGVAWPVAVFPGGLLLRAGATVVGAVGVGGSTDPVNDATIAAAAVKALTA